MLVQELQQLSLGLPLRKYVRPQPANGTAFQLEVWASSRRCCGIASATCFFRAGRVWHQGREGRQVTFSGCDLPYNDNDNDDNNDNNDNNTNNNNNNNNNDNNKIQILHVYGKIQKFCNNDDNLSEKKKKKAILYYVHYI